MIHELDDIILTTTLPQFGLAPGDIGTVVLVHRDGAGYEVEFTTLQGDTVVVVTLLASQVRATNTGEIPHARELASV